MIIKLTILFLFILVTTGIGIYAHSRVKSVNDFVLGGRNVGPWLTAFAYGTSYFSAVVFIGYAGQFGWKFGVSAVWIGIGNAVIGSMLAWLILGRRTRVMTKHFESSTMPEFFEHRYLSKSLKLVASVIIFVFLVPYSASIYKGLSGLFSMAFGLDFSYCVIGMGILTGIYVVVGGYVATAMNDFIQGLIMLVGITAVVYSVLHANGGLFTSLTQLSYYNPDGTQMAGSLISFIGPDPVNLLGVMLLTSLGTWGLPQMIHKFYAVKDEKTIRTGTIISTLFALIIAGGSYFMGAFGRLFVSGSSVPEGGFDNIVPSMLQRMPDLLFGVVIILVLSASMSTLSSLVITSSSTFTIDFLKGFLFREMDNRRQMLVIRVLCGIFVLISILIALNPNNLITNLMSISWGALSGAFLGPFFYGLFWKGTTRAGVWVGFICGVGITITGFILNLNHIVLSGHLALLNAPPNVGVLAILVSLIIVPLVSLLTKKLPAESVEDAFSSL